MSQVTLKFQNKIRKAFSLESSPFFYIIGSVAYLGIFVAYPIVRVIYMSLMHNILTQPDKGVYFVGLNNFISLFKNQEFLMAILRTGSWTIISVTGKVIIGFIIALLLINIKYGKKLYLFLLFIPWVTPNVVGAITWRWIFDGQLGMLNWILLKVGIISQPISWLSSNMYSFIFTAFVDMWAGIPFMAIVFMGGLQTVSKNMLEAASIDGATYLQKLFYIRLPMIKPIFLVSTTLSAIWTFNSFQIIWPLTAGGPVNATETLIIMAYKQSFGFYDIGMGSAVAVVIFIILLIFSMIYSRMLTRTE